MILKIWPDSSRIFGGSRDAVGAIFDVGERKSRQRTKHHVEAAHTPAHASDDRMFGAPDKSGAHDRKVPRICFRELSDDTLLPNFRDRIGPHLIDIAHKRRVFVHDTRCAPPIIDNEATDEDQALHRRTRHGFKEALRGDDTGGKLHILISARRRRQVNDNVNTVEGIGKVRAVAEIGTKYFNFACPRLSWSPPAAPSHARNGLELTSAEPQSGQEIRRRRSQELS